MFRNLGLAIYRGFFWTYERGTWQYDIMVVLILAFIFLTPRQWFHDKPVLKSPSSSDVVLLLQQDSQRVYQLRAGLIATTGEGIEQGVRRILRGFTGRPVEITRIEPSTNSSGEVVAYAVWVRE